MIKDEEVEPNKKLTRGLIRRLRNNNKDAEEGKYFEKEISEAERSYSPTTVDSKESNKNEEMISDNSSEI